jgi:capsular exopolysaccharide synthesis family protein
VETHQAEGLDYTAILRGMWRRHKLLVAGIFFGVAGSLLLFLYLTSQPLYVSTATINIDSSPFEQIPFFKEVPKKDNIAIHLALLRSRSLSEGVVEALPKESFEELVNNAQYTDYILALTNLVKRWLGKPPTVLGPQQRAVAELQNARMEFVQPPLTPGIVNIKGTASGPRVAMDMVNTYIQLLLSRTRNANQEEARKAREFLEQQTQQAKSSLVQAEEVATKFEQQKGRIKLGAQTELDLVKLSQTENALAEAQASREVMVARIAGARQSLDQAKTKEAKRSTEAQSKGKDEGAPGPDPRTVETLARFNAFKVAQDNLARLEAKLAAMRDRYTEVHPLVQTTQEEVTREQARVAQLARDLPVVAPINESRSPRAIPAASSERTEIERQLATLETEDATLQAKVETLKIQVDRQQKNIRSLSKEEVEYSSLHRTVEASRNLLTVLSDKLMTARIREQGETGVVRIIDPASFPIQPSQSKTYRLALMALAMAGGIAFGAAFGIEFWRQPIETGSDVQKVTGLPVLGYVGVIARPNVGPKSRQRIQTSSLPIHLPSSTLPAGIHMDLYRAIRATIETERLKTPFSTILVSSPGPNEGKSTTVLNLGHVFHEFGRRVLVVEADLRRPLLHRTLGLSCNPGLVDFLSGTATFEQVCRRVPSGITVIPGQVARENAAGLLASPRLKELLSLAGTQFDLILVDSAPILAVPDNLLLAAALDRVILVVRASKTSRRDLLSAQTTLRQANAHILGVILNQVNPADAHYYHPRYRKYYKASEAKTQQEAQRRSGLSSWLGKR